MDGKPRKEGFLEKTVQLFDLPGDMLDGLPRLELVGDRDLRMSNHKGILSYGTEEISVSGGKMIVHIVGRELELRAMNGEELLITGFITCVEFR